MNILITGSSGFVGKRLAAALKAKGHRVKGFDLSQGNNLLNASQCEKACKNINAVYHLAAVLDEKSPVLFEVNVKGTKNILEAAAKARCSQFIFLSTVGVHGNFKGVVDEKSPIKPSTGYEKSKAAAEKIVVESQELLPATIARSAIVFGPNKFWKSIVRLVEKGFPIIGGGQQQWQTIFVDDLVSALVFVLGKEACIGETFVVAEQKKHSLRDLHAEIMNALGIKEEIATAPVWQAKLLALFYRLIGKESIISNAHIERLVRQRSYNTGKINGLGWKAKVGMKEAVKRTVQALSA